jgi:hypothetical protein
LCVVGDAEIGSQLSVSDNIVIVLLVTQNLGAPTAVSPLDDTPDLLRSA